MEAALPAIIGYIAVTLIIGFSVKKEFKKTHTESESVCFFLIILRL